MRISSSNSEGSPIAGAVVTCGAGVIGGTAAGAGEVMAEILKRYHVKKEFKTIIIYIITNG